MKKLLYSLFIPLLLILFLTSSIYSQTVNTGFNGSATLKGAVQYRNFGNAGNANTAKAYLGNGDLTTKVNVTTAWNAPLPPIYTSTTTSIIFKYESNTLKASINGGSFVDYSSGDLGSLNYIEIEVVGGQSQTTVSLNNVKINTNTFSGNNFTSPPTKQINITGVNLTGSFTIEADVVLTGSQPGGDANYILIKVGYLVPPATDDKAPIVTNVLADPNYAELGMPITVTANVNDKTTGENNIVSAEYSLDGGDWTAMNATDGTFDSPDEDVTAALTSLSCGEHTICVRGTDALGNTSLGSDCYDFIIYELGSVSGMVDVGGNGVGGVIIKLVRLDGVTQTEVGTTMSDPNNPDGYYEFTDLIPSEYRLLLVEPMGLVADQSEKEFEVVYCDNDVTVNFTLTPVPITNNARSKGYWKHQFDTHLKGKTVGFQETKDQMNSYIGIIEEHYLSHFGIDEIFTNGSIDLFQYWSDVLSYGGPNMKSKAMGELAALLFNFASLKISQLEVVTLDGNDVSDVITEASNIIKDPNSTKAALEKAKNICEYVNVQMKIAAGLVPDHNILYKNGMSGFNSVTEYSLSSNFPNPFNPSTLITYALPQSGLVTLKVYDILGNEVATLANEVKSEGIHSVNFNASGLSSGVYLYKIQAGSFIQTKKMTLMK